LLVVCYLDSGIFRIILNKEFQSISINFNQFQSISINFNLFQSISINLLKMLPYFFSGLL